MTIPGSFELDTKTIGALPIVNHLLDRLRFGHFLGKHLPPPDPRSRLAPAKALGLLLRNLVLARVPIYSLEEWATDKVPALLKVSSSDIHLLNDDRVGRALDGLFDTDRRALLTDLMVHMVKEFDLSLEQLHNDSTSITLHGEYKDATGELVRGKPSLQVTFGYNKDHRPDLKQLVFILTVSADGAVPVHFKVADGNTEDSTTHIETWDCLRRLVGSSQFLYVADSKLCTRANLKHIADNHGMFVTIMPRSRKEDRLFKDWLQENTPSWKEVVRKPHLRLKDGPPDIFLAIPSPIPDSDGFRVIWYLSSHKMERDAQFRRNAIQSAWNQIQRLKERLEGPRCRFRTRSGVARAIDEILESQKAARWIRYKISTVEETAFRQEKRGRPGNNTRWRRKLKTSYKISWELHQEHIDYDTRCDGLFPLITNCKEEKLSILAVLDAYKSKQPFVEKRHDLLKNVEVATPMYLKSVSRIEALLFLLFVALLVHALIEREVRKAMKARRTKTLPLYPEARACKAPSAARILEVFGNLQRHLLSKTGRLVQRFDPDLSDGQHDLLDILRVSADAFKNL
jgi:transposase